MRHRWLGTWLLAACTSSESGEAAPPDADHRRDVTAQVVAPPSTTADAREDAAPLEPKPSSDTPATEARVFVEPPQPPRAVSRCERAAVLLSDANVALRDGDHPNARNKWLALMRDFPQCPEVPFAFLALAEHMFAEGDIAAAATSYGKVVQLADGELRAFAQYKLGWCAINLNDATAALDHFVAVARAGEAADASPGLLRLRDAALRDSTGAYVMIGDPAKAGAFYRRIAGTQAGVVLELLASRYRTAGDDAAARVVSER